MSESKLTNRDVISMFKQFAVDRTGWISDDNGWSERAILEAMRQSRVRLIKEKKKKGELIGPETFQTLPCVDLKELDRNECPCAPPSNCYWLRTIKPLPKIITLTSVTDILGKRTFDFVEWYDIRYRFNSRIKSERKKPFYTLRDIGDGTYLYLLNTDFLKVLSVTGLFEDATEALCFPNCGKIDQDVICNPLDQPFLLDRELLDVSFKLAWDSLLRVRSMSFPDIANDDLDNTAVIKQE